MVKRGERNLVCQHGLVSFATSAWISLYLLHGPAVVLHRNKGGGAMNPALLYVMNKDQNAPDGLRMAVCECGSILG